MAETTCMHQPLVQHWLVSHWHKIVFVILNAAYCLHLCIILCIVIPELVSLQGEVEIYQELPAEQAAAAALLLGGFNNSGSSIGGGGGSGGAAQHHRPALLATMLGPAQTDSPKMALATTGGAGVQKGEDWDDGVNCQCGQHSPLAVASRAASAAAAAGALFGAGGALATNSALCSLPNPLAPHTHALFQHQQQHPSAGNNSMLQGVGAPLPQPFQSSPGVAAVAAGGGGGGVATFPAAARLATAVQHAAISNGGSPASRARQPWHAVPLTLQPQQQQPQPMHPAPPQAHYASPCAAGDMPSFSAGVAPGPLLVPDHHQQQQPQQPSFSAGVAAGRDLLPCQQQPSASQQPQLQPAVVADHPPPSWQQQQRLPRQLDLTGISERLPSAPAALELQSGAGGGYSTVAAAAVIGPPAQLHLGSPPPPSSSYKGPMQAPTQPTRHSLSAAVESLAQPIIAGLGGGSSGGGPVALLAGPQAVRPLRRLIGQAVGVDLSTLPTTAMAADGGDAMDTSADGNGGGRGGNGTTAVNPAAATGSQPSHAAAAGQRLAAVGQRLEDEDALMEADSFLEGLIRSMASTGFERGPGSGGTGPGSLPMPYLHSTSWGLAGGGPAGTPPVVILAVKGPGDTLGLASLEPPPPSAQPPTPSAGGGASGGGHPVVGSGQGMRLIQVRLGKRVEAVEAGVLVRRRWAPRSLSWAVAVMASVRQRRRRQQQSWLPLLQLLVKQDAVRARWQPMATLRGMQGD